MQLSFRTAQRGVAILEFAITSPLLLLVLLGVVEFARVIKSRQEAVIFSREVVRTVVRECIGSDLTEDPGFDLLVCVRGSLEMIRPRAEEQLGEATVIISVYRHSGLIIENILTSRLDTGPVTTRVSRINSTLLEQNSNGLSADNDVVTIGEVFLRPKYLSKIGEVFADLELYEVVEL